jgi:hypothetical protein
MLWLRWPKIITWKRVIIKASGFVMDGSQTTCSARRGRLAAILLRMAESGFCAMADEPPAGILEANNKGKGV